VALGTGNFGTGWGYGVDPAASTEVFNAYADAGGNFVDTADIYQFGQSEELLGTLLPSFAPRRWRLCAKWWRSISA